MGKIDFIKSQRSESNFVGFGPSCGCSNFILGINLFFFSSAKLWRNWRPPVIDSGRPINDFWLAPPPLSRRINNPSAVRPVKDWNAHLMSEMHQLTASSRDGRKQPIGVHFWSSARPVSMKFIDGAGRWPAITRPFVNVFSCGLHRSIAADTLYISSFGSEEIGRNAELQFLKKFRPDARLLF